MTLAGARAKTKPVNNKCKCTWEEAGNGYYTFVERQRRTEKNLKLDLG